MRNKDFQDVILEAFIEKQAISLAKHFDKSESDLDALTAISVLSAWLDMTVDAAIIEKETDND